MPTEQLRKFSKSSTIEQLICHVLDVSSVPTEIVAAQADLAEIDSVAKHLKAKDRKRSEWDSELVDPVHKALAAIPRSLQLDPQFWEYLTAERFRQLVWERWWDGKPPTDLAAAQTEGPSKWRRFSCRRTMNGMSRNAIARLFWAGDLLGESGDYTLAKQMFAKQETQQQVFDRLFGLHADAAKAFVRACNGRTGAEIQKLGEKLNEYGSTIALEYLTDKEVGALLV